MKIAIILCTKNGAKFIREQLESLLKQSISDYDLYINDDCSTDSTFRIAKTFEKEWPSKNFYLTNIHYGSASDNFFGTLKKAGKEYDYYFFCDQDDIWSPNKIEVSIKSLKKFYKVPALFCGRTKLISAKGENLGKSPKFKRAPSIRNAIIQSIAGGNTMCFNKKVFKILDRLNCKGAPSHDWLLYQIVCAHYGKVIYKDTPLVMYRQHNKNLIGSNSSILSKIKRLISLMNGNYRNWNLKNVQILEQLDLSEKKSYFLYIFSSKIQNGSMFERVYYALKLKLYRQGNIQTLILYIAIALKKI